MATSTTNQFPLEAQDTQAMNGEPLRCKVTITNPQGFHMRPQSAFAQLAGKYRSSVYLYIAEEKKFDGKSPFSLLGLVAEQGAAVTVEVCGPDQEDALDALVELLTNLADLDSELEDETRET
jgi:phosphocarrier protein HPr